MSYNNPTKLLFADENGKVCDKNCGWQLQFDQLSSYEFKNSKNLMMVIKFLKRKLDQISFNNSKILNKSLMTVVMNYVLMCSSNKIQEFEPKIQPEQEQDFLKYALSFLKHFIAFIPKEETLRGVSFEIIFIMCGVWLSRVCVIGYVSLNFEENQPCSCSSFFLSCSNLLIWNCLWLSN